MSGSSARKLRRRDVDLLAGGEISYLRAPSGVETDFIWSRGDASIASELKSSARWQRQYSSGLRRSVDEKMVSRAFGIYLGPHVLRDGKVEILPIQEFLPRLWTGRKL